MTPIVMVNSQAMTHRTDVNPYMRDHGIQPLEIIEQSSLHQYYNNFDVKTEEALFPDLSQDINCEDDAILGP